MKRLYLQSDLKVEIQWQEDAWLEQKSIEEWRREFFRAISLTFQIISWSYPSEVSILLTDDQTIQDLNYRYRNQDKSTNVLSFSVFEDPFSEDFSNQQEGILLGDIVFAFQTVLKESEEQKKSFHHHVIHLVVHGVLHLMGYDHEVDHDAHKMEALEVNILNKLSINNPYQS